MKLHPNRILIAVASMTMLAIAASASEPTSSNVTTTHFPNTDKGKVEHQRLLRGSTRLADGIMGRVGTQEEFKTNKGHGPITFYDVPYSDGTFAISWNHELAQTVTFVFDTMVKDERQHVLKLRFQPDSLQFITYTPEPQIITKPITIKPATWHETKVSFKGDMVRIEVDGQSFEAKHPSYAQVKTSSGVMHGWGTLQTKGCTITER